MIRLSSVILFLLLTLGTSAIQAQDPVDIANARGSALIDSTMALLNIRAQHFNEELARINALKALDVPSLVKDSIAKNKEKIKDFLSYLDVYRELSKRYMDAVEDSVKQLRKLMPNRLKIAFMQDFIDAYKLDQNPFDKYTLELTKLFTKVQKALTYLEASKITFVDKKIQFTDKKEYEEYNELITEVENSQKKVATAGATSQRSSIDANALMQKAYGKLTRK
jgi:hypothetical protein